ncbi:MAG: hypothetical protein HQL01_02545, partial [Nitrospirae bacterium]|nr:hypothetical protein [Nitrospirota bacterium]
MIIEEISGHSPDRAAKVAKAMQAIETAEAAASLKRAGIEPGSLSMLDDAPASSRADNSGMPNPSATPTTADLKNLKPLDNGINNSAAALNAIIAKAQISIFEVIRTMSDNIFDSLGIKFNTGNAAAQRLDID